MLPPAGHILKVFAVSALCCLLHPTAAEPTPENFTVAYVGDTGVGPNARQVFRFIRDEDVDLLVLLGDYGYGSKVSTWFEMFKANLGTSIPVFAVVGNHDVMQWRIHGGYAHRFHGRLQGQGLDHLCSGDRFDFGVNTVCQYKGILFSLSGIGSLDIGIDHHEFLHYSFTEHNSRWRVCAFHKTQRLFQVAIHPDLVGYEVYELCKRYGAAVMNGHDHNYARSKGMNSVQPCIEHADTVYDGKDLIELDEDHGSIVVTGTGGKYYSNYDSDLETKPWWGRTGDPDQDENFEYGATFCTYNYAGNEDLAKCVFKTISGVEYDTFYIKSKLPEDDYAAYSDVEPTNCDGLPGDECCSPETKCSDNEGTCSENDDCASSYCGTECPMPSPCEHPIPTDNELGWDKTDKCCAACDPALDDCNDGNVCTSETCELDQDKNSHVCQREKLTGIDCGFFDADFPEVCVFGECVPDIDLLNLGCKTDADCSDNNQCNGAETCNVTEGFCQNGAAVKCDVGYECQINSKGQGACQQVPSILEVTEPICCHKNNGDCVEYDPATGCQAPYNNEKTGYTCQIDGHGQGTCQQVQVEGTGKTWGSLNESRLFDPIFLLQHQEYGFMNDLIDKIKLSGGTFAPPTPNVTQTYMDGIDVFVVAGLDEGVTFSDDEHETLWNFVDSGGVLIIGADFEDFSSVYQPLTAPFGIAGSGFVGDFAGKAKRTKDGPPILIDGVKKIFFNVGSVFSIEHDDVEVLVEYDKEPFIALRDCIGLGGGAVIVCGSPECLKQSDVKQEDNLQFANNIVDWLDAR